MDRVRNYETAGEVPDRFYLNEMKREISYLSAEGNLMASDLQQAATIVDLDLLGIVIQQGDSAAPQDFRSIMGTNHDLTKQLWQYMSQAFTDTAYRRGYEDEADLRASTVSLSSACIQLARLVDTVKVDKLGMDAKTAFTNTYVTTIATGAASGLITNNLDKVNDGTLTFASKLSEEAFSKTAMERERKSWAWAKTHVVAESLVDYLSLYNILVSLPELSTGDIEMLRRQNTELSEASESLVTYTPKPAIGTLEGTSIETLFVDQDVHEHTMISSVHRSRTTPVKLFPKGTLTSSNVKLTYKSVYKGPGGKATRIEVEGVNGIVPHSEVVIYNNRELTIRGAHLMDFADKTGTEGQATLLTSMILGQKFDLTVPSYIVDLANEEAETIEADSTAEPQADKLRRLLIARTRVLKTLGSDIDAEMQKDEAESEFNHRDIIKHGVVGHIRRLPVGYSPSQSARDLCLEELGVLLPEGHTYVKKHTRGNLELNDRGHKMFRNPSSAGKLALGIK